jgi:hypothetical protein
MDNEQAFLCRCANQFLTVFYHLGNPSVIQIGELNEIVSVFKNVFIPRIQVRIKNDHLTSDTIIDSYLHDDNSLILYFHPKFSNDFSCQLYYNIAIMVTFYVRIHEYKKTHTRITIEDINRLEDEVCTSDLISRLNTFLSLTDVNNESGGIFDFYKQFIICNIFGLSLQPILVLPTN